MPSKHILCDGAVALVTGASSGIGSAIAEALAANGARVICVGRNEEKLQALAEKLGANACPVVLDVTDGKAVTMLMETVPEEYRKVDILVANAGHDVGGRTRFDLGDVGDWDDIIDTNLKGTIRVCHSVVQGMIARDCGHIITMGSVDGLRTRAGGSIYCASKFAVRAFTETLRADFKDTRLRVTEILPGLVRTGFAAARWGGDTDAGDAFYDSAPQTLRPEDIANCVVFALQAPPHVNISQLVVHPTNEV